MTPYYQSDDGRVTLYHGSVLDVLPELEAESVQVCVTSPPYWGLRDYGCEGQIGSEQSPQEFVATMVRVFGEVRRVLRKDGTLWCNLGDSYTSGNRATRDPALVSASSGVTNRSAGMVRAPTPEGLKPKDLCLIPARVAIALQEAGWWVRSDIIWCLSGGTLVYARTQKGDMPMTIKDLARLDPATVKLWNGERWTQLLGLSKKPRNGDELEIVLRSGERISCTPTHKFPTQRGLLTASEIRIGDKLQSCELPEGESAQPYHLGNGAAWLAGLYIAEGSMAGDTIQIAGHAKEEERWERLQALARDYGGSATRTVKGNAMNIRLYGKLLVAVIQHLVHGSDAKTKGFNPAVWQYDNEFIRAMLNGYLSGDGHWDAANNRWRLGFCRNYNLERDLRTIAARLGLCLTLKLSRVAYNGGHQPTFRGEIRDKQSAHHNNRSRNDVVGIRKARCRYVYDLGVEDEPHLFALASGILTHNSKPNPMPESCTDRPTKAHEYLFLMSESGASTFWTHRDLPGTRQKPAPDYRWVNLETQEELREPPADMKGWKRINLWRGHDYFYDTEAIKERGVESRPWGTREKVGQFDGTDYTPQELSTLGIAAIDNGGKRNKRSVWTIATQSFSEAHFATFPEKLVEPCIRAGTSERGCCVECGSPWARVTKPTPEYAKNFGGNTGADSDRYGKGYQKHSKACVAEYVTEGWQPTCKCEDGTATEPCTVLDPFNGAGTTGLVALRLGRRYVGIDLNREYLDMTIKRLEPLLAQGVLAMGA